MRFIGHAFPSAGRGFLLRPWSINFLSRRIREDRDKRQTPRALTPAELQSLLSAAPPLRRLRYMLGAYAGLRVQEASRVRWEHLNLDAGWIMLTSDMTKEGRDAELPMLEPVRALAAELKPGDARPGNRVFGPLPDWGTWLRDLENAGIIRVVFKAGAKRNYGRNMERVEGYTDDRGLVLSRRCLRKTFGTHLAAKGVSVVEWSHLMRHTDPSLTRRLYQDARLIDLTGAANRMLEDAGTSLVPKTSSSGATHFNTVQPSLPPGNAASA